MLHEYDRNYHKLWLSQTSHLWEDKVGLTKLLLIFSCKFYFLFLLLLALDKDFPCTKVPLPLLKKGIDLDVQWLLLSRSLSLQHDSKYLKELECSRFFHSHLFSDNCHLPVYQHDFLATRQNREMIFHTDLDFHIPGPVWWNIRINCQQNTMFFF